MKKNLIILAIVFVGFSFSGSVEATLIVNGDVADGDVDNNTLIGTTGETLRVGKTGAGTVEYAGVLVFQMPALPVGQEISGANLEVELTYTSGITGWTGRLEGLRFNGSSSTVLGTDYSTAGTLVQEDFLVSGMSLGAVNTDSTGDTNLASWLGGASTGDWVFLRMKPSTTGLPNYQHFKIATANNATVDFRPVLTIETQVIPEPSSFVLLLGFGGIMILRALKGTVTKS